MEYEGFVEEQMSLLFGRLTEIPRDAYGPVSYAFIDFFSSGVCMEHYLNHGYEQVISPVSFKGDEKLPDNQKETVRKVCVAFHMLGVYSYKKLMEETKIAPNLGEISEVVGFVARKLGISDYCPPSMEALLEEASPSDAAN